MNKEEFESNLKSAIKKEETVLPKPSGKTLPDLNNILFDQLEQLNNAKNITELDQQIKKTLAVSTIASQIIKNADTCIHAMKIVAENKNLNRADIEFLGIGNGKKEL